MRIARLALIAGLATLAVEGLATDAPARAYADVTPPATSDKIKRADRLFDEGKALLDSNPLQACAKFDESLRLNPAAIGTVLNVARCDERFGRVASAVARFTEARDRAVEQGLREHVRVAEEFIAKLTPDIPHVTITLTEQIADTKVLIDDRVTALDALASIPVDPGERVIVVSAPARLPYRTTIVLDKADREAVVIPALAVSVVVTSSQRRIGQITTAAGGLVLGAGIGVGLYARNLYNTQFGHTTAGDGRCDATSNLCEARGQTRIQRARTLGNVGTAISLVGVAAVGVGVYLWWRSPSGSAGTGDPDKDLAIVPALGTDSFGIAATGRFWSF
jgi:hypothetical protein